MKVYGEKHICNIKRVLTWHLLDYLITLSVLSYLQFFLFIFSPLRKMTVGMILAALAFCAATVVEINVIVCTFFKINKTKFYLKIFCGAIKSGYLELVDVNWKLHFISVARKRLWSLLLPKKALFKFTILWIQMLLWNFQVTVSSQSHLNHMR